MGYYSEVKILTSVEGARAAAMASKKACEEHGNDYPILTIGEDGGIVVNLGEMVKEEEGAVVLWWPEVKWYSTDAAPAFADVRAIEEVVESGDYPMQMIRAGENYDDVERLGYVEVDMIDAVGCALEARVVIETWR